MDGVRASLIVAVAFGAMIIAPRTQADVYSYQDPQGVMHLSNVPVDARFVVLLPESLRVPKVESAPEVVPPKTNVPERYAAIVASAAREHHLDPALLRAVITIESGYNPRAVSRKGAIGLMQLMPQTAQRYGVTDLYNPRQNIRAGASYLRDLLERFNNDLSLTLAAYNAGEDAVVRYGHRIPPFDETRQYVPRILALYQRYRPESR